MRLIDADKVMQEFEKNIKAHESDEYEEGINTGISWCTEDVVNAQTVEAIPIEFIKRFAIFFPPTSTYIYGEEIIDMDAWCEELLERWEEENERTN